MNNDPPPAAPLPLWRRALNTGLRLGVVLVVVLLVKMGLSFVTDQLALMESDVAARARIGLVFMVLFFYALLLAIPFVPGVEIGIAILMVEGAGAAPFVYLATVTGMSLAFFIGHHVALGWLIRFCNDLGLHRVGRLLRRIKDRSHDERLAAFAERLPRGLGLIVVRYRYVMLAVLINIPGTIAIGGGGGIMLAAGFSRLFHPALAFLTIALATLPVPLTVWVMGTQVLQ
ncbi:hypothetical protein [Yoonia sp.]|uniref:hypothetical protein n=1 Tax=Yoonia sp. TaxID=2212373 RepID=UPI001A0BC4A0|nr:hypothetical protein [Yoonia sp.]MBE0414769.1 hypothetical protein [Yoonia sp.]